MLSARVTSSPAMTASPPAPTEGPGPVSRHHQSRASTVTVQAVSVVAHTQPHRRPHRHCVTFAHVVHGQAAVGGAAAKPTRHGSRPLHAARRAARCIPPQRGCISPTTSWCTFALMATCFVARHEGWCHRPRSYVACHVPCSAADVARTEALAGRNRTCPRDSCRRRRPRPCPNDVRRTEGLAPSLQCRPPQRQLRYAAAVRTVDERGQAVRRTL